MKNRVVYFLLPLGLLTGLGFLVLHRAQIKFYILQKASRFWPHDAAILCALGKLYYKGHGTPINVRRSFECYKKAASLNNPKALYKLGNLHCHRYQIEKGPEADQFFWNSIPFNLREALRCYRKAASMNYRSAYTRLGRFSFIGAGTQRSYRDALYWYSKAAHLGSARAQHWVGYLYAHAPSFDSNETPSSLWDNVPLDYKKALTWFTKAAEQGEAKAQCWLGYFHAHGGLFFQAWALSDNEHDLNKAVEWFEKATNKNDENALKWLVHLSHVAGNIINRPSEKIFAWYMDAALKEHLLAKRLVGSCYEFGIGTQRNFKHAIEWYAKAAEAGDPFAKRYATNLMKMLDIKPYEINNTPLSTSMPSPMTSPSLSLS